MMTLLSLCNDNMPCGSGIQVNCRHLETMMPFLMPFFLSHYQPHSKAQKPMAESAFLSPLPC